MTEELAPTTPTDVIAVDSATIDKETALKLIMGDISKLTTEQKLKYHNYLCESLGLNPASKPFQIIEFKDGKQSLYALKDCTDQLRKIHGVSIVESVTIMEHDLCVVKVRVQDREGRFDVATGIVPMFKTYSGKRTALSGDDLANAMMKAETKAKRRATLSICGLGALDESELDTIPGYITKDIGDTTTTVVEKELPAVKLSNDVGLELARTLTVEDVKAIWLKYPDLHKKRVFIDAVNKEKKTAMIIDEYIAAKDVRVETLHSCMSLSVKEYTNMMNDILDEINISEMSDEYKEDINLVASKFLAISIAQEEKKNG